MKIFYCQADTELSAILQTEDQYGQDVKIGQIKKDGRLEMAAYEDRWKVQVLNPLSMMEDKQIRKLADEHEVHVHHYDSFESPPYKDDDDLRNAVIVIYSSQYGRWQMAINQDGSVVKPGQHLGEKIRQTIDMLEKALNTNAHKQDTPDP